VDCDLAQFCKMIRERAERLPPLSPGIRNPLEAMEKLIIDTYTRQAYVLVNLRASLQLGRGEFHSSDIYAFDAEGLRVADALIEYTLAGFDRQ
jgi:hypothetical protein